MFIQNFGVTNKEYYGTFMAFSVVVKKSYLVIIRVICEWNERIEWLENVGFFHGSEAAITEGE